MVEVLTFPYFLILSFPASVRGRDNSYFSIIGIFLLDGGMTGHSEFRFYIVLPPPLIDNNNSGIYFKIWFYQVFLLPPLCVQPAGPCEDPSWFLFHSALWLEDFSASPQVSFKLQWGRRHGETEFKCLTFWAHCCPTSLLSTSSLTLVLVFLFSQALLFLNSLMVLLEAVGWGGEDHFILSPLLTPLLGWIRRGGPKDGSVAA